MNEIIKQVCKNSRISIEDLKYNILYEVKNEKQS